MVMVGATFPGHSLHANWDQCDRQGLSSVWIEGGYLRIWLVPCIKMMLGRSRICVNNGLLLSRLLQKIVFEASGLGLGLGLGLCFMSG